LARIALMGTIARRTTRGWWLRWTRPDAAIATPIEAAGRRSKQRAADRRRRLHECDVTTRVFTDHKPGAKDVANSLELGARRAVDDMLDGGYQAEDSGGLRRRGRKRHGSRR